MASRTGVSYAGFNLIWCCYEKLPALREAAEAMLRQLDENESET